MFMVDSMFMMAFQKNDSIAGHVLREISSICVSTKLRDIKVTYIVSGWLRVGSSRKQLKIQVVGSEQSLWFCVYTFT